MDHPFRSAAIGGFNKQDVLSFLEEQAAQANQAQQKLEKELEGVRQELEVLRQERDALARELDQARQSLEVEGQERAKLNARLEQAERELSAGRERAGKAAQELEQTREECDSLRRERDALRPDAKAYLELKERTAGVELEAHRRAQAIQEKAESDAAHLRSQLELWLCRLRGEYDGLCSNVESTVAHAASQLERAGGELNRLLALMAGQEDVFAGLDRICGGDCFGGTAPPASGQDQ